VQNLERLMNPAGFMRDRIRGPWTRVALSLRLKDPLGPVTTGNKKKKGPNAKGASSPQTCRTWAVSSLMSASFVGSLPPSCSGGTWFKGLG